MLIRPSGWGDYGITLHSEREFKECGSLMSLARKFWNPDRVGLTFTGGYLNDVELVASTDAQNESRAVFHGVKHCDPFKYDVGEVLLLKFNNAVRILKELQNIGTPKAEREGLDAILTDNRLVNGDGSLTLHVLHLAELGVDSSDPYHNWNDTAKICPSVAKKGPYYELTPAKKSDGKAKLIFLPKDIVEKRVPVRQIVHHWLNPAGKKGIYEADEPTDKPLVYYALNPSGMQIFPHLSNSK